MEDVTHAVAPPMLILTGANAKFFSNLRVNIGSWLAHMREFKLGVCDFGLTNDQKSELARIDGLYVLESEQPPEHPWLGKSLAGRFAERFPYPWEILQWIDADAFFTSPLPPIAPLLDGYDLLTDAHIQAIGELCPPDRLQLLQLRADDAYFSAGWWIARRGVLLDSYERLCAQLAHDRRKLWEGDAFVAAIYQEKLKIRTVCGGIWHSRWKTSLLTCTVKDNTPRHEGHPIYVLHANAVCDLRDDGRRVFANPALARLQDHYENVYFAECRGDDVPLAARV